MNKYKYLDELISKQIEFSKTIKWNSQNKHLIVANDVNQILEAFKLRYLVYEYEGYLTCEDREKDIITLFSKRIPEPFNICGLLFDEYEQNSITLNYIKKDEVVGSIRISFDIDKGLPFQENGYDFFSKLTQNYSTIELTRQVTCPEQRGDKLIWPSFYREIYRFSQENHFERVVADIAESHYKLYKKFGGVTVEANLGNIYGVNENIFFLSWRTELASNFFKRVILKEKNIMV
ncbi:hypothetical protein BGP_5923 [Beggiatoa sp. PS]|nr:hypothetical protein BGP_5923 [Beggiatoa sp. PS]